MSKATTSKSERAPFRERLRVFREARAQSRDELAAELGVAAITLYRWERGATRPSPLAGERLSQLGFGAVRPEETNRDTVPKLKAAGAAARDAASELRENGWRTVKGHHGPKKVLVAPFVRNGPPDQEDFHEKIIQMQASSKRLSKKALWPRLSMIESVADAGPTAQFSLEGERPRAVSWNSNYGPHGWHRYVGRFPPHVVRALLNSFGANNKTPVLDPFAGSGTTAVECRMLGIPFVGMEICPLSCLITRTKASFPVDGTPLTETVDALQEFYSKQVSRIAGGQEPSSLTHDQILDRRSNLVPRFANVERWFNPEALLGTSLVVEFGMSLPAGFERDAVLLALSSKMRSIGNVDVDVVRAEYRKKPRENVDVLGLVTRQLRKMQKDILRTVKTHDGLMGSPELVKLHEGSCLEVDLEPRSMSFAITSPPYGVESLSYLRTHLLSYRALVAELKHDPYDTRDKTIGSEYVPGENQEPVNKSSEFSPTCRDFFARESGDPKLKARRNAMIQFFDDMHDVGARLANWMKRGGQVAFIVGNKRLGDDVIPTDAIISELFAESGFETLENIRHKLKTNNSNSQVPWQERIIQEESILILKKVRN